MNGKLENATLNPYRGVTPTPLMYWSMNDSFKRHTEVNKEIKLRINAHRREGLGRFTGLPLWTDWGRKP
jgi:hypothetical protein